MIKAYWKRFCEVSGVDENTSYEAFAFGDDVLMADELAKLIQNGTKTATTSAFELYEDGDSIPRVGDYAIVLSGASEPVCVIQNTRVYTMPYNQISSKHAYLEGEFDRSYGAWKKAHDAFFKAQYEECGKVFQEDALMLCEEFVKVFES